MKPTPDDPLHPDKIERFFKSLAVDDKIMAMSDADLSAAVIDKVWGNMVLFSEEELLLDELLSRFERMRGIERDEDGEIVPETPSPGTVMAAELRKECNSLTPAQRAEAFKRGMALINGETPPATS